MSHQSRRRKIYENGGHHTPAEYKALLERQGWKCKNCDVQMIPYCFDGHNRPQPTAATKDHIIPISKGGSNDIENIQSLCVKCHKWKTWWQAPLRWKWIHITDWKDDLIYEYFQKMLRVVHVQLHDWGKWSIGGMNVAHIICLRRLLRIKSGEHYWLCSKCHPRNHAEQHAIATAKICGKELKGTIMELRGHYHACDSCKALADKEGIKIVIKD